MVVERCVVNYRIWLSERRYWWGGVSGVVAVAGDGVIVPIGG